MRREFAILLGLLALASCDGSGTGTEQRDQQPANQPSTQGQTQNPAPQTGTGGESQSNPPADGNQQ